MAGEKPISLLDRAASYFDKKDGLSLPTTDSLLTGQAEPDDDQTAAMREASEYYQSLRGEHISRDDLLPRKDPDNNPFVDMGNILAGDLMASFGATLDKEGLSWSFDTAKDFISEHPVRAGVAVALNILPALAGMTKAYRFNKFATLPDDMLRASGVVDEAVDMVLVPEVEKRMLRQQAYQIQETRMLNNKVDGELATPMEKAKWVFNKNFGNSYVEQMSAAHNAEGAMGLSKAYSERMNKIVKGEDIANLLENLPEKTTGTAIAKYLNDPNELANIPKAAQPFALAFADKARSVQAAGLEEGFLTNDQVNKVGDIYINTLRKGSEMTNEGVTNSIFSVPVKGNKAKLKILSVPRTTSTSLLERSTTKSELSTILNRQEAAEALGAGDRGKALKLLAAKNEDPGLLKAVTDGDDTKALGILGESGFIDTAPESLTVKSLLQQSLLLENFRYLRDVAMNPAYTKSAEEFAALSAPTKKVMRNLDELPNSHILRRMVGKKSGLTGPIEKLGYIHEDMFKELTSASTGQPGVAQSMVSMIDVLTALHKTSHTALNPYSQGQNIWGNFAFLAMRGWNPFNKGNLDLVFKKSIPAIWNMQRAARRGSNVITELNLGSVASKIGGPEISIAEELASNEVSNLIEKSSLLASEGIGTLNRLSKKAGDSQYFVKAIINGTQKAVDKIPTLNQAIDSYLASDGAVKLGYYLDLRSRGFSRLGASLEVARALPMYNTMGDTPKVLRKAMLPWISFPSEALRIMKNNTMDYPLRTAMWFHGVDFMQALTGYATGTSAQETSLIKEGLPTYGNKPTTLVTPLKDSNGDFRAATLDFLPWSSFLPQSSSGDANLQETLPFGMGQPLPIFEGIQMALTGQDQFGRPIPTEPGSLVDKARIIALGTIGIAAPPMVSKYALNATAPTMTYRMMQDLGKARNPYTTKAGDPVYDMILNNIGSLGTAKFYPSSPEQMVGNKSLTDRMVQDWRGKLTRNWSAFMRSGDVNSASETFADIKRSFLLEWKDPAIAQKKETDFLLRHIRNLQELPQLQSFSKDKIIQMIKETGDKVAGMRSQTYDRTVEMMRQELAARSGKKAGASGSSLGSSLGGSAGSSLGSGL